MGSGRARLGWVLALLLATAGGAGLAHADSAEVLPQGVWRAETGVRYWLPIDRRFDPDGDTESLAADFNASLNSRVFAGLGVLETLFGLPPGFGSVGDSRVSFEYQFTDIALGLAYGITDRLTFGVQWEYWFQKNKVSARLDTTRATVGKSPGVGALLPLGATPDTVPLTTADVIQLLGSGLDVNGDGIPDIPGFGFKRFETWSDSGFNDLEVGFKYQYLKREDWRLAASLGARFPTGQVDDPDDLVDVAFGDGAYGVLFRFYHDYIAVKNLVLNATFRYDLIVPDKEVKRVPDDVNQPITTNRENVSRDLGDIFRFEVSGVYTLYPGLTVGLLYEFAFKLKDDVSGRRGFAYESLEEETNWTSHIGRVELAYTTVPLYLEKRFPLPLTASPSYRNRSPAPTT